MRVLIFLLFPLICTANTEIAFIKIFRPNGQVLMLEPDFEYAHSAIKIEGSWLHTHPSRGVELVEDFAEIGFWDFEIKVISIDMEISDHRQYLGRPFDHYYLWDDEALYCSELIAKLLGIMPEPMIFDSEIWGEHPAQGLLGISPGQVFNFLMSNGGQIVESY